MLSNKEMMRLAGTRELSFEPKSLWEFKKNKLLEKVLDFGDHSTMQKELRRSSADWVRAGSGGYLSRWNGEFMKRIVEFFTFENATIFDPFAGHTSSIIPWLMRRNFIGVELSNERFDSQLKHIEKLSTLVNRKQFVKLYNEDSATFNADITVDCIITDPPYFSLERYSNNDSDLSNQKQFKDYLGLLNSIITKSIKYLKSSGYFILKMSDVKLNGVSYPIRALVLDMLASELIFEQEIIIESNPAKRHPLYPQAIAKGRCLNSFESLLVFRKLGNFQSYDIKVIQSRPLVSSVYSGSDRNKLFWSGDKIDWVTRKLYLEMWGKLSA